VKSLRNGANDGLSVPAKALLGTPGSLAFEWMQARWGAEATGGKLFCILKAKRKSRLNTTSLRHIRLPVDHNVQRANVEIC
jgi:hypothetical protein